MIERLRSGWSRQRLQTIGASKFWCLLVFGIAACTAPSGGEPGPPSTERVQAYRGAVGGARGPARPLPQRVSRKLNIQELPATIRQEWQDRVARLDRVYRSRGLQPPAVREDLQIDAGTFPGVAYAIPVIRVSYPTHAFFDFDETAVRAEAQPVLDALAASMRRDLPDTHLLVVGHTDSVGSLAYNDELARARALQVFTDLIARGVRPQQMNVVAMGERQPQATNATGEGRARNRRVEFMIAAFREANFALVEDRAVNAGWLNNHARASTKPVSKTSTEVAPARVEVLGLRETSQAEVIVPEKVATLTLRAPEIVELDLKEGKTSSRAEEDGAKKGDEE